MTPFQVVAIITLAVLLLRELVGFWREAGPQMMRFLRGLVWLGAAAAIAAPNLVQALAEAVGIGRGADFVFYFFVLAFLGAAFYFYARLIRMQRQVSQLVRVLAIQQARQGHAAD